MDVLERLRAALADRYALVRRIGSGGMATVYLAEDLRHHRRVAIKVLRPEVAEPLGGDRFFREIEIAARLQHPHILPLLDSGEADGLLYYVMPYVEGESLRARLAREGELPVPGAVRILAEVADALAYAHEHGVVHRDVKPDNVLLSARHALVTDFGVAKAVSEATGRERLTTAGIALGTPSYMAPEQAAGGAQVDHRADLYAFGAMGYEMLAGRPPFTAPTAAALLAAQVTQAPAPLADLRPSVPPPLAEVIMRCLAKRPADRPQSAREIGDRLELLGATSGAAPPAGAAAAAPGRRRLALAAGLAGAAVALALVAVLALRSRAEPAPSLGRRAAVTLDPGVELYPALSPDGKLVAYAGSRGGELKIFVRQVAGGAAVPLTEDLPGSHVAPAWSPDGTGIFFRSGRGVELVPALGGQPKLVLPAPAAPGLASAAVSPDGAAIAFVRGDTLLVRPLRGGPERVVTTAARQPDSPAWSGDGEWIAYVTGNPIFAAIGNLAPSALWVVPARGGSPVQIADAQTLNVSPAWMPHRRALLWVSSRDGGRDVYYVTLDRRGRPVGPPARLTTGLNAHGISLSADGRRLAFSIYTETSNVYVIRIAPDRSRSVGEAGALTAGSQIIEGVAVSPDGRWLAFDSDRAGDGRQHLYRMRLPGGPPEQLTADSADDFLPAYSPDGRELAFHRIESGVRDIFVMPADGGPPVRVTTNPDDDRQPRWTPDGKSLVYECTVAGGPQICLVTRGPAGWGPPKRLSRDGARFPSPSPDGRWIAYRSASRLGPLRTGPVVVMPSAGGEPREVAEAAGAAGVEMPLWTADGRSLVYSTFAGGRYAVRMTPADGRGPPREVLHVDDPTSQAHRFGLALHGDSLFFSLVTRQSDIWAADLVEGR